MRVLIVDDHQIVRRGIRAVVESRSGWEVIAKAEDGLQALALVAKHKPDIAIVDYSIPLMNGVETEVGEASRWNTLRALRVLDWYRT